MNTRAGPTPSDRPFPSLSSTKSSDANVTTSNVAQQAPGRALHQALGKPATASHIRALLPVGERFGLDAAAEMYQQLQARAQAEHVRLTGVMTARVVKAVLKTTGRQAETIQFQQAAHQLITAETLRLARPAALASPQRADRVLPVPPPADSPGAPMGKTETAKSDPPADPEHRSARSLVGQDPQMPRNDQTVQRLRLAADGSPPPRLLAGSPLAILRTGSRSPDLAGRCIELRTSATRSPQASNRLP
jgi:hypothetical protein